MSLKSERDLSQTSRNQVNRAMLAEQSKNYDYAISLWQAVLKDEHATSSELRECIFCRQNNGEDLKAKDFEEKAKLDATSVPGK